jgi:N6-L-threonylcarbamoyladenine synthase
MIVLGIETSCDETSCAVVDDEFRILSNSTYSQLEHSKYGGIVPEVASRQQIKKIVPIFRDCMEQAAMTIDAVDAVAVTCGPGLIGSLLVGVNFAKGISFATGKPLIGINHLEGHIYSNILSHPGLRPPFISLIISGGHTQLLSVEDYCRYKLLGETRDDAAGEAYDKVAKLLGLGYPGGDMIDKHAREGNSKFVRFPRAAVRGDPYAFSFSGLKTSVALHVNDKPASYVQDHLADICASFQEALVDSLVDRCLLAQSELSLGDIAVSGGVSANSRLRDVLQAESKRLGFRVYFPPLLLCTDNAAMIAAAGIVRLQRGESSDLSLDASAQLRLA